MPGGGRRKEASAKAVKPGGHIEEHIRLDVAHDPTVFKDEPFDFAVVVNQADAPLPTLIDDLPVVASEEGTVYRSGVEDVIRYRIEVTGTGCDVIPPNVTIELRPGESAKPRHLSSPRITPACA